MSESQSQADNATVDMDHLLLNGIDLGNEIADPALLFGDKGGKDTLHRQSCAKFCVTRDEPVAKDIPTQGSTVNTCSKGHLTKDGWTLREILVSSKAEAQDYWEAQLSSVGTVVAGLSIDEPERISADDWVGCRKFQVTASFMHHQASIRKADIANLGMEDSDAYRGLVGFTDNIVKVHGYLRDMSQASHSYDRLPEVQKGLGSVILQLATVASSFNSVMGKGHGFRAKQRALKRSLTEESDATSSHIPEGRKELIRAKYTKLITDGGGNSEAPPPGPSNAFYKRWAKATSDWPEVKDDSEIRRLCEICSLLSEDSEGQPGSSAGW